MLRFGMHVRCFISERLLRRLTYTCQGRQGRPGKVTYSPAAIQKLKIPSDYPLAGVANTMAAATNSSRSMKADPQYAIYH